ncbi:flagellar basal body P-ring formation chaperone FlgA [Salinisphaera sp. Q1T1-3]|uniref:flagellar basal body P-ring formation chaperone FlgA n=1 Tax=Salinisphaera sp. Q1T1-3 TaxID=2321229 RepID=UPI000E73C57F|nr:flagellar basal body P-ring formation chaperone FlgA [Salinisphaera sp. Q1T1-3]RJS95175.1 flagellar basal body P-ring formation protein FlgA [Salinisphaera sp. Q1T1-3]
MSKNRRTVRGVGLVALALGSMLAAPLAAQAGDHEALSSRIQDFLHAENAGVGDHVTVDINTPLANLKGCRDAQPFLPGRANRTTGRITVGLHCSGGGEETRYVQADVRVFGTYYVASRDIQTGRTLEAGDLTPRDGDITRNLDRLPANEKAIIGQQARRRIGESQAIVANMLTAPDLIRRGERVKIVSRGPGFSITTRGRALDNAAAGTSLRVRTDNGTVISGIPRSAGVVVISP